MITLQLLHQAVQTIGQLQKCGATTGNDALFDGRPGGVQGILDPQLAVLEFRFRGSTHFDDGDAAGELGDALVQLLAVVVGVGGIEFSLDGGHTVGDGGTVILRGHDRGALLADGDAASFAEIRQLHFVQGHRPVFTDQRSAGEDGDISEGRFAAFAEGWGPDSRHLQHAPVAIHHEGGQGFAFHFLGQDQQWRTTLLHRFKHRNEIGDGADLAIGEQDQRILELTDLAIGIGDEIGGAVATVEGHAFSDLKLRSQGFGLLNGDHPIGADTIHGFGNHPTHFVVTTGTDGGHLTDGISRHGLAALLKTVDHLCDGLFHATAELHRAGSCSRVAQTFPHHGLGQHRGRRGAVTGLVLGAGGHLLDQLGPKVLEGIIQFDFSGDGVAVIDDVGGTE